MEVEVVLGKVGEPCDIEVDAADPAEDQGVGGDLHDHVGHALVTHPGEERLERRRLGGGQRGRDLPAVDPGPGGADESDVAVPQQGTLHHVGRGRLAAGTGDADDGHVPRGVTVDLRGDGTEPLPAVVDHEGSALPGSVHEDAEPLLVGEHTVSGGLTGEPGAVGTGARHRHEQAVGGDVAGVDGGGRDGLLPLLRSRRCRRGRPARCTAGHVDETPARQLREAGERGTGRM